MDIEVIEDKDNVLLGRREVKLAMRFMGATPDRNAVREAIRSKLGVDPRLVVVGRILQPFGSQKAVVEARVYKDEAGRRMEHEHTLKREAGEKGGKKEKAGKPKEEAKEAPEGQKKEKPAEREAREEKGKPRKEAKEAPKEEKPVEKAGKPKEAKEKKPEEGK